MLNFLQMIHHFFSVVHDSTPSSVWLNNDFFSQWAYQWKMKFKPDNSKQTQDIFFLVKQLQLIMQLFTLTMFK